MNRKFKYIGSSKEQVEWGNNDDPSQFCKEGDELTLLESDEHNYHTKLIFTEFPDKKFNSVSFKEVTQEQHTRVYYSERTERALENMLSMSVQQLANFIEANPITEEDINKWAFLEMSLLAEMSQRDFKKIK